jgi:hypothetical protein
MLVALVLWVFVGCEHDVNTSGSIFGAWTSEYGDGYTITDSNVVYDDGYGYFGFTGTVEAIVEINAESGIIYFAYVSAQDDQGLVGKYNAIYYLDLTLTTAKMGTAANVDYSNPATDTLSEAKAKFTAGTVGIYLTSGGGAYTK